jgi:lysophospholipase L1-like esterase/flagellar basal body rod protein FlgB
MRFARALLVVAASLMAAPALAGDFALKDGDRVVFYGDSITDQRLYSTYVEAFVATRFPKRNITFVHSGWGGDRVGGGGGGPIDVRLKRDVIAYKPTVVSIMLGMNDASYRAFDDKIFETYSKGYEHILDSLKAALPDVRLTLIQPSPFDDVTRKPNFEGGYNAVLLKYGDYLKGLAAKRKATLADLNTGLVEATKKADATDHDTAVKFNPDRVHPAPAGQLLMAEGLLKAWDAPALVSSVEIDTEATSSVKAQNAKVTELVVGDSVTWSQEDEALPFPIDRADKVVAVALTSSDFLDALDRQTVKVAKLKAANYTLKIDGNAVGDFTREALAEGVNIANLDTPMWRQSRQVLEQIQLHNNTHFMRWRMMPASLAEFDPAYREAFDAIGRLEGEIVKKQRVTALPKPHRFELSPKS